MADAGADIAAFLEDAGWTGAKRAPLAGDASFRRYERVRGGSGTAVLMIAPPPNEDIGRFLALTRHLRELGYSAPAILAEDAPAGLALIEDLGDATYTRALADGADERALYARAIDLLADLHSRHEAVAVPPGLGAYDEDALLEEAALFTEWYLPKALGRTPPAEIKRRYEAIWRRLFTVLDECPETLVLRDFHADNLMWLPERPGIKACGLLDYQDAVRGAPAYDVMSLLEDARRDIAPGLVAEMLGRYTQAVKGDAGAFAAAYRVLAAQRHCKVIGIFTRLAERDGKYGYLVHIPRVWRLLEASCRAPVLAPLATWLDEAVPLDRRAIPASRRQA